jgi:hypothetical protein
MANGGGTLSSELGSAVEGQAMIKEKDLKRTWHAKRPLSATPNGIARRLKTRPRAGICRNGETQTRPWDTTNFQGLVIGAEKARKALQIGGSLIARTPRRYP